MEMTSVGQLSTHSSHALHRFLSTNAGIEHPPEDIEQTSDKGRPERRTTPEK
jgi:hypothetical protein